MAIPEEVDPERAADKIQRLMRIAEIIAENSTCDRAHVGALAVRSARILSTGYNGTPSGMPHCNHAQGGGPCELSVHAEANVVAFAARHGVSLTGATIVCTHAPCVACAGLIVNAGAAIVLYRQPYRDTRGLAILRAANRKVLQV